MFSNPVMNQESRLLLSALVCGVLLSGCGGDNNRSRAPAPPVAEPGAWSVGDLHVHTYQSNDAQVPLAGVLHDAFLDYQLDWLSISNHLRVSNRDVDGAPLPEGNIPYFKALTEHEIPLINQILDEPEYAGKVVYTSFEWDMPTHDHVNVAIGLSDPFSEQTLRGIAEFEYLFTDRPEDMFDPALIETLAGEPRSQNRHEDALRGLAWIRDNHPDSYLLLNHPSRYMNKYTIAQIRALHDLAPEQFIAIEGMVGNQMEPDRGGYVESYIEENLTSRTYGGVDYLVATLGGAWDALLGEGRRIWNVANSDYHFTIADGRHSSGYAPGEYAKTYMWKDGEDTTAILEGLRSGRLFGVFGDLIDALDFRAETSQQRAHMGGTLQAGDGHPVTVTIRFRSPDINHYEYPVESGQSASMRPRVNHVDLIVGDVQPPAEPGSPAYDNATNLSTRVLARFTANDWQQDEEGYNVITYSFNAERNQYLRLRGTNLAINVPNQTVDGEPQPDERIDIDSHQARFDAINARNYQDLWFYSNPIFIAVE